MLAVLVPSRGRPENLRRVINAIRKTASSSYRVYVYLDDDDPALDGYGGVLKSAWRTIGPRVYFAAAVNQLAAHAVKDRATHLAILGDDVLPETPGWDETLIAALDGRLGVAYGSDGLEDKHGKDLPTHVVVPTEMYWRLGWIALPTLRHLYCDNVWRELGRAVDNLIYRPDVRLTHLHRWNHQAPDDQTYREANDKQLREVDRRAFEVWRDGDGYRDAVKALT